MSYDPPGLSGSAAENALPSNVARWNSSADPYITDINVTTLSTTNDGLDGDVVIGYFEPLMEIFDGPDDTNEIYFMVLNGLINPDANCAESQQNIHIEFDFTSNPDVNSLQRLSRDTGQVEIVPLTHDTGLEYHLDLVLGGGEADLFKFNTGAPFITDGGCDFDYLGDVNFTDFAYFAQWWVSDFCGDPGWCYGKDIDKDGQVYNSDLADCVANWLQQ